VRQLAGEDATGGAATDGAAARVATHVINAAVNIPACSPRGCAGHLTVELSLSLAGDLTELSVGLAGDLSMRLAGELTV
jgi:hypothetical protein